MKVVRWETGGSVFHCFPSLLVLFRLFSRANWISQNPIKNCQMSNLPTSRKKVAEQLKSRGSYLLNLLVTLSSLSVGWHRYSIGNYISVTEWRTGYRPYKNNLHPPYAACTPALLGWGTLHWAQKCFLLSSPSQIQMQLLQAPIKFIHDN